MSQSSNHSHVPDPRYLTHYAESHDSLLHRLNPWTKAAVLPLLVVAVTVARGLVAVGVLYAAVLGLYAVSGLPVRRLVGWYSLPFVFVSAVGVPVAFGVEGTRLVGVGGITLTVEGVTAYLEMLGRGLTVVTYSLGVWMTTRYNEVAYVLGRSLPEPLDQILLLAYRFSFVMVEVVEDLVKALRSRGSDFLTEFWNNRALYGSIVGAAFIDSVERSERIVKSMESRGYDGDLTVYTTVEKPPMRETVLLAGLGVGVLTYSLRFTYGVV